MEDNDIQLAREFATFIDTIPLSPDELFPEPVDEKTLVKRVNTFLKADNIKASLLKNNVVTACCGQIKLTELKLVQKYFNKSNGWSVYLHKGSCGNGCVNYKEGNVSEHIQFFILDRETKSY